MLTRENNELICRVGAHMPMGKALRRYWLPVMQSSDLPSPDGDPFPLETLGTSSSRSATPMAWSAFSTSIVVTARRRWSLAGARATAFAVSSTAGNSRSTGP